MNRFESCYETCILCGIRKEIDYFTKGGLCDRKCEECVGKDYVPEFARTENERTASLVASIALSITVTAMASFAAGYYVAAAQAAHQVLEVLR